MASDRLIKDGRKIGKAAAQPRPARCAADSRQQILNVTARLLRVRGYTETSLRDIGAEAGMKAASVYYHFSSKEELAREVLRIGVERVHQAVLVAVSALGHRATPRAKLQAAISAHLETLLIESDYTSAHIRCFHYVPPGLKSALRQARHNYEEVWRQLLAEAEAASELPRGIDPQMARLALLGTLNWSLEWFDPSRRPPADLTRTLLAAFTR